MVEDLAMKSLDELITFGRNETNYIDVHFIGYTKATVSSGFLNTRKLMNERSSRPSAFIVFECLETLMKHEARAYEMASPKGLIYY